MISFKIHNNSERYLGKVELVTFTDKENECQKKEVTCKSHNVNIRTESRSPVKRSIFNHQTHEQAKQLKVFVNEKNMHISFN